MGRRFSDRHGLHTLSELNVTPLLDLAFVLLIIFMITTPLMENSSDLVLPDSDTGAPAAESDKTQSVAVHADGHITLNGEPMDLAELERTLAERRANDPALAVLIRSHQGQTVQRFAEALDAARRAGVKRIGFASKPTD